MRKILPILLLLLIAAGCSSSTDEKKEEKKTACEKSVKWGDIDICLTKVDGMTECYGKPQVKQRADAMQASGNTLLAYYINDSTYKKIDKLDEGMYDDYFAIYATNTTKNAKAGKTELEFIEKAVIGSLNKESWDSIKNKVNMKNLSVSIGRPLLIEKYSSNENTRTLAMLTKMQTETDEIVLITVLNILLIKDRLVCLAYYKNYNGEKSLKGAKAKNDHIVLQVLDENK